jgi:glyoxylase-like metal-dependent hydrolase (beta-lactamase superfamily II)
MQLGEFELHTIHENRFWIDGGAMFGVVPRVLWQTLTRPDDRNRIALRANLVLIKTGDKNILVEAGLGDAIPEKWKVNYGVEGPSRMPAQLRQRGLEPGDIDMVIPTHLHFDHVGGCAVFEADDFRPAFPSAQHLVQRVEWEDALSPDARSRASYMPEMLLPLSQSGLLRLLDGHTEVATGVQVMVTGGHTRGHQIVLVSSGGKTALITGDLIPTGSHLKIPYVAGVDLFPLVTMEQKENMIHRAVQEGWLVLFGHDTEIDGGYLSQDSKGRVQVKPVAIVS